MSLSKKNIKMKIITCLKKLLIVFAFLVIGYGCSEDFLEKPLYNDLNSSTFYQTEDDFKAAIIACYEVFSWYGSRAAGLQGWLYRINYTLTDLSHPGGYGGPESEMEPLWDYRFDGSITRVFVRPYRGFYSAIMRSNTILEQIQDADIDEQIKKTITAEAKFCRAFSHFFLARMYGDVPLIDYVPTDDRLYPERTPAIEIYDFIIEDIENSYMDLPTSWSGTNLGRATQGAAMMLLSKTYLTKAGYILDPKTGTWAKEMDQNQMNWEGALRWAQAIIDLNEYSLWQDEDVSAYQGAIPSDWANADKVESGYQMNFWTENDGDLHDKESIFEVQYYSIWPDRYANGNLTQEGSNTNDFDLSFESGIAEYGYNSNHPRSAFVDSYEEGDKRKLATILAPGDTLWLRQWSPDWENEEGYYVHDGELGPYPTVMGSEGYIVKKWLYGRPDERESSPVNEVVWRYAEVLLIKAEALNELGRTSEAYEAINQVRKRAGLGDLTPGLSRDDFREAVYEERKFELAYEKKRWFDAVRTGKLIEWVLADRTVPIQQYHYILPLPTEIVDLNDNLYQNFGF